MMSLKNYIAEQLMHTSIFEHAFSLHDFDKTANGLSQSIVTHVIKIVHGRKLCYDLRSENHHKTELMAWCTELQSMKLKSGSDKHKRLYRIFVDMNEYCTFDTINELTKYVFFKAPAKIQQMLPISPRDSECISQVILELIRLISNPRMGPVLEYIENL